MTRSFVIVVADDWGFRSCCRGALVAAGYRVATPTTRDGAEYFLASAYPPHVVVFSARERWEDVLREAIPDAVRPPAIAVVDRCPDEKLGTRPLEEAVQAALEQLASEPLAWRDDLTLRVELLDAPHRAQLALLNALERAARSGRQQDGIDRLQELRIHAKAHFAGEESLMQLHGFPDREEHAREHARLLDEIGQLAAHWARDDPPPTAWFVVSLRDWVEGHILTMDRALAARLGRGPASRKDA
jgi:hemerythrin-like metal-binding protein